MGLIIALFGMLIAGAVFFFFMPFGLQTLSYIFNTPQISYKQGLKLTFGFMFLGTIGLAFSFGAVQLFFHVIGSSFSSKAYSTDSIELVLFIVITISIYFFGMVLFLHQELNEPFHRALRIAPIFLIAMVAVFAALFYVISILFAKSWLG